MRTRAFMNEKGQSTVTVAILVAIIVTAAALVIDIGRMILTKADLQNAADAAALAAAQELPDNPSQALLVAGNYLIKNGISGDQATVTLGSDNKSVSVTVNGIQDMLFAKALGVNSTSLSADATAKVGIAASVPWIVPFVIPKPTSLSYDKVYVMRMYGGGDFLDYPKTRTNSTGYPGGYSYPGDYLSNLVYKNYPVSNPYPYQFDYMNVYIEKNTNFSNYIDWLENGYHKTFALNQDMYYYAPSSGGKESVDAFARRCSRDANTDYGNAKLGDGRVMLIPVVESMLKRGTRTDGSIAVKIAGFVGFFIEKVHKNSYGQTFWFEGRFLENFNIGSGEVTYDTSADFGLRVQKLTR